MTAEATEKKAPVVIPDPIRHPSPYDIISCREELYPGISSMAEHKEGAPAKKSGRKDRVVLIAEDDAGSLSCISTLLTRFDYKILKTTSARQTLAAATSLAPSLAVISLDLAGMTGFLLMRQLKNSPVTSHIPLIGLAGPDSPDLKDRCFGHGAVAYLRRPVEAETFYRTVQQAIEENPRTSMRVRTILPVRVYGKQCDSLFGAYTLALSAGGMFLHTMNPVSVNSGISLEFDLNGRAIAAETVVLYNCQSGCGPGRETGIGLRFVDIAPKDQDSIREFIRSEVTKGITFADHQ